jgi:hypothetical protein
MSIDAREIRCTACGSLLAKLAGGALVIQRGDLQATVAGQLQAELVCYRRTCRRTTVVHVVSPSTGRAATAPPRESRG